MVGRNITTIIMYKQIASMTWKSSLMKGFIFIGMVMRTIFASSKPVLRLRIALATQF
jgi:hypothetical protein